MPYRITRLDLTLLHEGKGGEKNPHAAGAIEMATIYHTHTHTVNLESSGHMRNKCISSDFTLPFPTDPTIFSLLMSYTTMNQGICWAGIKLMWIPSNSIYDTKSKLPNSSLGTRVKWHMTPLVPAHFHHGTSQGPHSVLWGSQWPGSHCLSYCSSATVSTTCLGTMHFWFFLPGTFSADISKAQALPSGLCPVRVLSPLPIHSLPVTLSDFSSDMYIYLFIITLSPVLE